MGLLEVWLLLVRVESVIEKSIIVVLLGLNQLLVYEGSGIVFLSFVHVLEIVENPLVFHGFFVEYLEHDFGGFGVDGVTVLGLHNVLPFSVKQSFKMLVVDVLNIEPLDFEKSLEF